MLKPQEVLDRYYLETRCMLLETAAVLDRYDAAVEREGSTATDELKLDVLHKALQVLAEPKSRDRAEELLKVFTEVPT
ncbi:MAG: hypothetical protein CMI30_09325 [Opitutae bacterium]|nr:hypothetical protein [Opitutae bacterium]